MFGLFKKKKLYEITNREIFFFEEIIKFLPTRYHYIFDQLNKDFLLSFKPNVLNFKNWYSIQLNAKLEEKHSKRRSGYFQLQNIFIYNKKNKKQQQIVLSFLEGIFIGFYIEDLQIEHYDLSKIDTSKLKEKHFKNEHEKDELTNIVGKLNHKQLESLDIENTFKIELPEGNFYTIKNLTDGDYLAVDEIGIVYELRHDPYSIIKVAESIDHLKIERK